MRQMSSEKMRKMCAKLGVGFVTGGFKRARKGNGSASGTLVPAGTPPPRVKEKKPADAGTAGSLDNDPNPFGRDAFARSLERSREVLRTELARLGESAELELAEAFAEFLDGEAKSSPDSLFHLGHAMGFETLQKILEALGPTHREAFAGALANTLPVAIDDLQGTLIARRMAVGAETRRILRREKADWNTQPLRAVLLKLSEDQLKTWAAEETAPALIAYVLKILPQARAAELLLSLPAGLSLDTAVALDGPEDGTEVARLVERLTPYVKRRSEASRSDRLLRHAAVKARVEDEERVLAMLPKANFELRRDLLRERAFLADLAFVPAGDLRAVLEKRTLKERVQLLYLLPEETRTRLLRNFPAGSKTLESLTVDLEALDISGERREALLTTRGAVLTPFLKDVSVRLAADPSAVNAVIRGIATAAGEPIPDWAVARPVAPV